MPVELHYNSIQTLTKSCNVKIKFFSGVKHSPFPELPQVENTLSRAYSHMAIPEIILATPLIQLSDVLPAFCV